jgi:hypothetical protein
MMKKSQLFVIALFVATATYASLVVYYFEGFPKQKDTHIPNFESLNTTRIPEGTPNFYAKRAIGRVVIDGAHENAYTTSEISSLLESFNEIGVETEIVESLEDFDRALNYADSLVVISPYTVYTRDEVSSVKAFLRKGGKLALIYDPTRGGVINSLSSQIDVVFVPDYLYNMNDNAGNFRNIFVDEFRPSPITSGIERVTLFTASSIESNAGIAFTDEKTTSSLLGDGPHSPVVLISDSIFAIADQSFMEHPNDRVSDNGILISNIASFLGEGKRSYTLEDFPFFFSDVAIRYSNESLIDYALDVRGIFVDARIRSEISEEKSGETFYIGVINESEGELDVLSDVIINNTLIVGGIEHDLDMTALIILRGKDMWLLSTEKGPIGDLIDILANGEVKYFQINKNLAILPFEPTIEDEVIGIEDEFINQTQTNFSTGVLEPQTYF